MNWKFLQGSIQRARRTNTLALVPTAESSSATGTHENERHTATSALRVRDCPHQMDVILSPVWEVRASSPHVMLNKVWEVRASSPLDESARLVWADKPGKTSIQSFPIRLLPGIWIIAELVFQRLGPWPFRLVVGLRTRWHFGSAPNQGS